MNKLLLIIALCVGVAGSALAGSFRVHYTTQRGQGRDVTIQAQSSAEARRTVMDMFPGVIVTGVHEVRQAKH